MEQVKPSARRGWRHAAEQEAIIALLRTHPVLRVLTEHEIVQLLVHSQTQKLSRGATLFVAGDRGSLIYAVLNGYIKLTRSSASGREILLEIAGPGSLFGELAVLNNWQRSVDAIALTRTRVLAIDGRRLLAASNRSPEAMLAITRLVSERLARATDQVEDQLLPGPARLARVLSRLAALCARRTARGLEIYPALSQRELGDLAGLSRESINKQLAAWRNARVIEVNGKSLVLTDPGLLRILADEPGAVPPSQAQIKRDPEHRTAAMATRIDA